MLTLATILDNPGEPNAETRYRDFHELRRLGYNGLATYLTTGLSGLLGPQTISNADLRRWVDDQYDRLDQLARDARAADLRLYLAYDAPSLARELVGSAMTCANQPHVLCPASNELLEMTGQCLEALIGRVDAVEGVVLRLGDSDAHRLAYLMGNDIYSPHCARCNSMGRADRLTRYIRFFYEQVVERLGRTLIVRAWNVRPGGLHDNAELCRRVAGQLPEDDRLILSFKFTQTDFWRYQQWNPASLACGDRPIIYELQCQREFEGKGAMPNYQVPLWRDGMSELDDAEGLSGIADRVNLAGLWGWVRGGGWGGPFITNEAWIDANVMAIPRLADNPKADVNALALAWIDERLDCRDASARSAIAQVLARSPQTVLESFYVGPYARMRSDPWYPSGNFVQDDMIDAEAAWSMIDRLPESVLDEAIHEKQRAVERIARDRRLLQQVSGQVIRPPGEALANSMQYAEALVEALQFLLVGLVNFRRYRRKADPATARAIREAVSHCQSYWNHHQRYANFRGTASAFRSENLWDFTQQMLDSLSD